MIAKVLQNDELHPHDDFDEFYNMYHGKEFHDDITAQPLDNDMAVRTRNA